jgi:KDO2-lipid IV(A) lauroyltransferase
VRGTLEPRRWTLHGLNNGTLFKATLALVARLPRAVSYVIGDGATWLAARWMPETRAAIASNLAAVFPAEPAAALERRARRTLQAYARDTVDFIRALSADAAGTAALFDMPPVYRARLEDVLARGRGGILVTGHYGNWEVGSVLVRRVLDMPLTIVAMAEASPDVNRMRREIRARLGVETIEVRQSLDTALQIRRRLSENALVAMLMDRHLGRDRVQVQLLGRPAWFLRTPAVLAYLSGAPLLPCLIQRTNRTPAFSVLLGEPIWIDHSQPRDAAIQQAAQQVADQLTDRIRQHPECWYHFYRYWDAQDDSYGGLV